MSSRVLKRSKTINLYWCHWEPSWSKTCKQNVQTIVQTSISQPVMVVRERNKGKNRRAEHFFFLKIYEVCGTSLWGECCPSQIWEQHLGQQALPMSRWWLTWLNTGNNSRRFGKVMSRCWNEQEWDCKGWTVWGDMKFSFTGMWCWPSESLSTLSLLFAFPLSDLQQNTWEAKKDAWYAFTPFLLYLTPNQPSHLRAAGGMLVRLFAQHDWVQDAARDHNPPFTASLMQGFARVRCSWCCYNLSLS